MTTGPVQIPAVDRPDKFVFGLTTRQLAILATTGLLLYFAWSALQHVVPTSVFLVFAVPIGALAALFALGQRDGLSLDRLMLAAVRQYPQPRYRVSAPEGIRPAPAWMTARISRNSQDASPVPSIAPAPLRLPAQAVTSTGLIDLGNDGVAVIAVCSTVNFALRTPQEQEALVAAFARWLHSLTAPVQIVVRAERLDLTRQIQALRDAAGGLPHPALEQAAREHADYLAQLRATTQLLRSQVLLVLREPLPTIAAGSASPLAGLRRINRSAAPNNIDAGARRAAEARLARRLTEATELLAPAGITVTTLDPGQSTAVLAAACNPDSLIPPSAGLAGADEVITTAPISPDDTTAARWQDDWSDDQPEQATPAERLRDESDAWDEDDEPWSQR